MTQESFPSTNLDSLFLKWYHRFKKSEDAHYKSANSCRIFNYALGIPLVIITTITASEYFMFYEKICRKSYEQSGFEDIGFPVLIVVILTLLAPVIAALQTFLRFPERAEEHRKAAVNFGLLKKEVEKIRIFPPIDPEQLEEVITRIQKKDSQIMNESPSIGAISLWTVNVRLKREAKGGFLKRILSKQEKGDV